MAWIPFDTRSADIQSAIQARVSGSEMTAQAFYDANELGLLDEAALLSWLSHDPIDQAFTSQPSSVTQSTAAAVTQREEDIYVVKTLGWLMQNANSLEDKVIARKHYRALLFDLWRKHLARTGETWYPPLRNDLWERYQYNNGVVSD